MKRKLLWKVFGAGMLTFGLILSPIAGANVQAAEPEDSMVKNGGLVKDLDPLRTEAVEAVGTEGEEGYIPGKEAYADTEIPVWAFTEDATVYSVDVEWGAMTFQWENSSWNPETHMKKEGAGWKVYDSEKNKALDVTEDAINEIKVTNHSNAKVWATLAYNGEENYTDTTGKFGFEKGTEDDDANVLTDKNGDVPAYLTLDTADNAENAGEAGTPTVGKAYFMPDGIKEEYKKDDGIAKWTKIGIITVSIKTEVPTAENQADTEENP
ncbi:MAG: hypothetical protein K2M78_10220 [Lachnospiraceae bacterium]|nr:hypothetical protein [Lachnospiraceae bacterium]